ncbi:MAG: hypothetical protein LBP37_04685 [Spirochaetaceae bacterium]|jgi:hypothetical protein|nr:hypothetical protein [Spirochaetaceae bacterium]
MESKKYWLRISILTVAVGIILAGCSQPTDSDHTSMNSDPTYSVWTDSGTYADFQTAFGGATLQDGQYVRIDITNAQFSQMSLPNEYKQNWTESQIYNWFIGRGFGATEANREKSWVITVNHGLIASRTGNIVYTLIK